MKEDKPFSIMTPRLQLKELTVTDADPLFQYRSLPEISRFQGWSPASVDEAIHFVEEEICHTLNLPDTWFQLGIFLREEETLVGDLGIHFLPDGSPRGKVDLLDGGKGAVEIGVTLAPWFQGRGFGHEAVQNVLGFLFETLHKNMVTASVDPENQESINLVKRAGFQLEGINKSSVLFRGEWVDDAVFTITRNQWINIQKPTF